MGATSRCWFRQGLWLAALAALVIGCTPSPTTTPGAAKTPTAAPSRTPAIRATPTSVAASWDVVRAGLEFARIEARVNEMDNIVIVARLDPALFEFRARYAPEAPHSVRDWMDEARADVAINANFFTPQNTALGLVIADGKIVGQSFRGFGGMFSVRAGRPALQWLTKTPYVADRRITQAVQCFPMLVEGGRAIGNIPDEGRRSFRSFVATDRAGRVLLGVAEVPTWTLTDLAQFLDEHPLLDVDKALNLDGGGSSGLWVKGVPEPLLMNSFDVVPVALTARAK